MAINPIALQAKAADTSGALNTLAAVRQIQAANQQRQMNQLAMEDAQRKRSSEEAFKNALMTGDYKTPAGMNRLMGIDPTSALALQKNLLDQETARKSALKSDLELFSKAAGGMPDTAENYSFLYKGAVGDNPALASFLPDPSQYKTGLMTQFAVGAETLFKRDTTEAANKARLDAAARTAAGRVQAAQIQAGAPQKPFAVGRSVFDPETRTFIEAPETKEPQKPFAVGKAVFDPETKTFIQAPETPEQQKPMIIPPGASVVDATGKELYKNPMSSKPKTINVSPGQVVIDEEGKELYKAAPTPPKETTEEIERAKLKVKQEANQPIVASRVENIVQSATRLKDLAAELKGHKGLSYVTGARAGREFAKEGTSFFNQEAANAKAIQDTIADMIFINVVNEMKGLSETGATGLGSITEKEGAKIQRSYQNLISTQDTKTYQSRLDDLIKQVDDSLKIINEAAQKTGGVDLDEVDKIVGIGG
jgi:hypothetical protein